jgi:hypothetical protein
MNHHDALRDIAQRARDVAALIHQPDHAGAGQFQTSVQEMKKHGPDVELRSIQGLLSDVAARIETYLRNRAV